MKPKVIVLFRGQANVFSALSDIADVQFDPFESHDEFLNELRDAVAVVVGGTRIDEEFLKNAPNLKIVARFGVGYDKVDVEACTERGIYVTYTPGALSSAVAELTMALILCLSRRLLEADRHVRTDWSNGSRFPFGVDLEGKILGIIGLGRIGRAVAFRAKAFDMKIICHDIAHNEDVEKSRSVELDDLLRLSDFVTIHVPLTSSTKHLLAERELRLMKRSAYLINTSRGPVIDEAALYRALKEGWIAGAGLDVFTKEPLPPDSLLLNLENVVLTPHIGSRTVETRRDMAQMVVENIRKVLQGEPPPNLIPEQSGMAF